MAGEGGHDLLPIGFAFATLTLLSHCSISLFFRDQKTLLLEERRNSDAPSDLFENMAKIIAKRWKSISKEDHVRYTQEADLDSARYRREMDEFNLRKAHESTKAASRVSLLGDSPPSQQVVTPPEPSWSVPEPAAAPSPPEPPQLPLNAQTLQLLALQLQTQAPAPQAPGVFASDPLTLVHNALLHAQQQQEEQQRQQQQQQQQWQLLQQLAAVPGLLQSNILQQLLLQQLIAGGAMASNPAPNNGQEKGAGDEHPAGSGP